MESDQRRNADQKQFDPYAAGDQHANDQPVGRPEAPDESPRESPVDAGFGDPRVDAAVARTDGLDERPIEEHVAVFDDVHRSFRETLDDPDADRSGG